MEAIEQAIFRLAAILDYLLHSGLIPRAQRWKQIQGGWAESSGSSVRYVAWGLGIVVALGVVFIVFQNIREKKKRNERELLYFDRKAVDKDLDRRHIDLLAKMIKIVPISSPYRVLESYDVFQHVVETYHDKQDFSEQEHKFFHQSIDEVKEALGYNKIEETVQLDSSEDIRKGQQVKLLIEKGGNTYEYASEVLFNTDERLTFDAGEMDLDFVKPGGDISVEVQFYRDSDAGYSFKSIPLGPPDKEKRELYLKHPKDKQLNRDQARSFSRMDVRFGFSYFHIPEKQFNNIEVDFNLDKCDSLPVFMAESIDISGGGIAFYTRRGIKKNDYLYLNFQQLSEEHSEPVLCQAVHVGVNEELKCNIVRAKFYNINETAQDLIMRFIYQMQRKAARKLKFAPKH
jgi:c-di-GMP-binding flagellar brake protein YcgR